MKFTMPPIGLGTWKSPADKAGEAVEYALTKAHYQHIDCAAIYKNEPEIGAVFEKVFTSKARKREDVFITSKLWNTEHRRERVRVACEKTLHDLHIDYLDLYLMHWGIAIPQNKKVSDTAGAREIEQIDEKGYLIT